MENIFINPLCIYKDKSVEGFACAWAIWRKFKNDFEFIPGSPTTIISNCRNRDIIIVGFSYNETDIMNILNEANSVTLIDNNKTSFDIIKNYKLLGIVNCNKSACILAWDYFHNTVPPMFMEYIQNREFWKFDLPYSKEVCAAITNYNLTFDNYDDLYETYIDDLVIEGQGILRKLNNDVENIIKYKKDVYFGDIKIPIVNCPYFYSNECSNFLADKYGVGASVYCVDNNFIFSLKSSANSDIDVYKIVQDYRGTGTKHSAEFRLTLEYDPIQQLIDSSKKRFGEV